jgi:hypothetical protein
MSWSFMNSWSLFARAVQSANPVSDAGGNPPPPPSIKASEISRNFSLLGNTEFWLSLLIVIFGAYVIFIQYRLFRSLRRPPSSGDIMRTFAVTTILVGTCIAMTAGYRSEQVAPVLGVFGTIAGYLLGRFERTRDGVKALEDRSANEQASTQSPPSSRRPAHRSSAQADAKNDAGFAKGQN